MNDDFRKDKARLAVIEALHQKEQPGACKDDRPLLNAICLTNPRYGVLVYPYLFGQYRIKVTDRERPDAGAPPNQGAIMRELDTYDRMVCFDALVDLFAAEDPIEHCISLERPWNVDFPGDRIRLDNRLEDRPELAGLDGS